MANQNVPSAWGAATRAAMSGRCDGSRCDGSTMEPEATREARIAVLQEEIEFIHYANELYWRDANPGDAAKADYYRRQDRLEEIRSELADLRKHN